MSEVREKRDVYREFHVDENGFIRSYGKFEGEHWSSVVIWDWYMSGDGTQLEDGSILFRLSDSEQDELECEAQEVILWVDDQGFVQTEYPAP